MINGDVYDFVVRAIYGEELWFMYHGKKYFLEGWNEDGRLDLYLYEMRDDGETYHWKGTLNHFPIDEFLEAKIWDVRPFWDAEQEMEWIDG